MGSRGPGDIPAVVRKRARRNRKPKPPSAADVQRATRGAAPLSSKPVRPKRVQRPPSAAAVQRQAGQARPLSQRPVTPRQVPTRAQPARPTATQRARAQEGAYVSQGKAVAAEAYRSKTVAERRRALKRAQAKPRSQRTTAEQAAVSVHHQRRSGDIAQRKVSGMTVQGARRLAAQGDQFASQAAAIAGAAKTADLAAAKVAKRRQSEGPLNVAGINFHVPKSVGRAITRTPLIKSVTDGVKALDATNKSLGSPAETALKNIDRPANAIRGEMKRDISRHGVKKFLFGAPHKASKKELKDIRQTAKRHLDLKEQTSGSDVLKAAGVKNKVVRAVGGFGVDAASSAATLPVGGVASSAARAGEKAAVGAAVKGARFSKPVRKAARGAREGAAARGADRAGQRVAAKEARRTARGRALTLAERKREAAIAAREAPRRGRAARVVRRTAARVLPQRTARAVGRRVGTRKVKAGQGIGLRYGGVEIPGTRAATAAVGRGVRKARGKPTVTETERRAARKFAQTERSARGGKEQAAARAQRVARTAHAGLKPQEHERVASALADNDLKRLTPHFEEAVAKARDELPDAKPGQVRRRAQKIHAREHPDEARLHAAAVDLRSSFRHEFKAERQAGVSTVRHPENFLGRGDRKSLQSSIAAQQREVKRSVQGAQRTHERARGVAQRHSAVADVRHGAERVPGKLESRIHVKADEALNILRSQQGRKVAARSIPQRGRGAGVPVGETDRAYLQRLVRHAKDNALPGLQRTAENMLAKAPKAEDVERGYFPREFAERAQRATGVAESTPTQGGARAVRTGTARVATPATGGHARVDPRRFDVVQAERAVKGEEPFSTNVPLVAGARTRSAGKAVTEADFARRVASHGRRVTSADDLQPGEKLYVLGRRGGKYGLHAARGTGRNVQKEWRDYDRAVADARRAGRDPAQVPKPRAPRRMPGGGTSPPGQHYALSEHTVRAMEEANRPMPAIEAKVFDKLTAGWKTLTTYTIRFHMRNNIGDIQRLMEMPGNPISTVAKLPAGLRAARGVRQAEKYRQTPGRLGLGGISDPLNKATITVAGKQMPVRDFVKMLDEHKLRDVGRTQQERAEAAIMRGESPESGKLLRGGPFQGMQGGPFGGRLGRTISVDFPNAIRATAFKTGLDAGLSPAKAADQAHKFFVDYGKLSAAERQIVRRIFPFYTWTARSLPVTLANFATRPARYANLNSARNEWNQAVTGMSSQELADRMKPFTANNLPVVIPIGGGKYAAVSASWPANLVQYVPSGIGPKAAVGEAGMIYKLGTGQLNWIAKLLVEGTSAGVTSAVPGDVGSGINLQTLKPIENADNPRVKAPSWAADLPAWAKKDLLVDHKKDRITGQDNVVWRGWASWALKQGSVGIAGQGLQATDTTRAGRINTTPAKIAEFLGVTVEDLGPDITKANAQIVKYQRAAQLNKRLQQLPEGVGKDHPTPEWRRLRDELNKLNKELRPPSKSRKKAGPLPLGSGAGGKLPLGGGSSAKLPLGGG